MNWKIKFSIWGLAFWFLLFLGWEWWKSYPKVRLTPISFPKNRDEKIDSVLIQSLSHYLLPGLAVGIIEEEKVTYLKAFGFENLQTKDSLTIQSELPVASVSKLFTALSLANFALEKGISIESTFNSILNKDKKLGDEFDQISLRDLLNHTSGLSDNQSIASIFIRDERRKLSNLPKHLHAPDLENKSYQYADVNFDLIGYALEVGSKIPFETVISDKILSAGGMEKSYFAPARPNETSPFSGHKQTFLWKRIEPTVLKYERYPSPSSGLILTPKDLSKALLHLSRGNMGAFGDELLWLQSDAEFPAGFQKITLNNSNFIGHFGEQGGFSSLVIYSPELEIGLFLISNGQDQHDFRKLIPEAILKILNP